MIRPTQDNVLIVLEPKPTETASGIALVPHLAKLKAHESRYARVIASGPGYFRARRALLGTRVYHEATDVLVANETKPGDRVLVDALAGQNYDFDLTAPRNNVGNEFTDLLAGRPGDYRIVRESEILGIVYEDDAQAAE